MGRLLDPNPVFFKVKMSHKLRNVREKLDGIAREKNKFHLREEVTVGDRDIAGILDWRQTSSLVNELEIIGRNKEKAELISMLLANSEHLSVYAICGMGGLGKTTLAQLVYNDETIKGHFDLRIWVCVSDDFDLRRLIMAIIESIDGCSPNCRELEPLQRILQEKLSRKRFLLVLDDVWNECADKWDGLRRTIGCGGTGSVVVVTTRNKNIALMTATSPICYIGRLSDDDSWSLFERRAFGLGRKEEVAHLETIGRDIVDMCGGVPLAIKALGSLLRLKRKENEWISVKDSELWNLSNDGSMILSALKLSYNHLALHVKRCFAFCSIFPKDRIMERDMLIGLWMANGFIPCETQIDLYNKGHEVFEELVWRSFFQDVKDEHVTGTITCKMHDLIHDLAQSITVDECKLIKSDKVLVVPKTIRHMSMYVNSQQAFPRGNKLFRGQQLRSFLWVGLRDRHQEAFPQGSHFIGGHKFISSNLWPGYPDRHRQVSFYMSGQKRLRVLDLSRSRLGKFPMPISSLKHLRYLDFSNSSIKILPELIISLQNLQTLNLRYCNNLCKLPRGLKYMKNLVHLDILGCSSLTYMPGEIGQLTCLRKLSDFIVGKDKGHHIGELKELNLGGELSIHKIQYVTSCGDAKTANLMGKKELSSLRLLWSQEEEEYSSNTFEEVLDGLQPHSNLKKLTIYYYRGSHYWMMDLLLPNLIQIDLVCCDGCKHLPPFGKLKFLRELEICGMNGVKCIENEIYGNGECSFPSLERLRLHCMGGLEELLMQVVAGRNVFPILESLVIIFCPKLVELPSMPSLRTLNICGGSRMLLRSVEKFGFVTSLSINGLDNSINLESLQNQLDKLPYLKSFKVEGIPELESLPERLSFLETLHVSSCGIKSFPSINGLCGYSSLRSLCFRSCSEFVGLSEGLRHLSGLEDLRLQELPKLSSLPDSIGYLTALRTLVISSCEGLSCLPNEIENLTSLSSLEIESCRNLMCLPDGIRNLETLRG